MPAPLATTRPSSDEYAPAFAGYVAGIADDEDVIAVLTRQHEDLLARLAGLAESRGNYSYAPGKWTVKEVIGHLSDTERVFAYRALRIGRGDRTPLTGYDDQAYVPEQRSGDRPLAEVAEEWGAVRHATLTLYRNFPPGAWDRLGTANEVPISVRALAYIIAGHTRHHADVLEARYFG